ncbi:MAG TPA: peptidoglycan DD-metalloendopeptidase family protein [Solirubrobacteraceae bacterium]|nr:peptidoglycan DD-metalloendopeptidase family protein [Solirubrobacteraceae bacterium]
MRLRRLCVLLSAVALPLLAWALLPVVSTGADSASLQRRITRDQGTIDQKKRHEGVLTTDITAFSRRIDSLQANISTLQGREDRLQADLDAKRAELTRIQEQLRFERARLARLRARLAASKVVLARRLREIYTADAPDIVTVLLNSHGFAELLERTEFMHRINEQDRSVIVAVKTAKDETAATARRLAGLEVRAQKVAATILARRDEVAVVKGRVQSTQSGLADARAGKQATLDATRSSRHKLEEDVRAMQAQQAKIQGDLAGGGPTRQGSGRFIWPVNGPITAPFCERRAWEACHPGIDIGASEGTPIHAADAGTVRIAASYGGYGNYTCIQHTASLSTCYGHQSAFAVGAGQNVSQGQVIGSVGCTGLCFGAHLHFEVRVNGSVVDPMGYL